MLASALIVASFLLALVSADPDCTRVDSQLVQLTQAADPTAFAASAGLNYSAAGVLAIVELVGDDEPAADTYSLTDTARFANLLQARVPLDQICSLAADPAVAFVRPPAASAPVGSNPIIWRAAVA